MNKEEIIQMLKDNPIKIIKCGDIEIPVEYLRQTTVNVNGDDYIRLQQENKQLKDNWNKLKEYFNERIEVCDNRLSSPFCNFEKTTKERLIFSQCLEKLEELEQGSDYDE